MNLFKRRNCSAQNIL